MGLLRPDDWKARWIEAGLGRGPEDVAAVPDAAPRVPPEGGPPLGARLRDEPRPLRARDQRPARGRPGLHARLDELREAPAVPDLRRDRATCAPARTRSARRSATAGTAATSPGETSATSTASAWRCCASSGSSTRTAASRWSAATTPGRRRPGRSGRRTSTWARATTRGSSGPAGARRATTTASGRRCAWRSRRPAPLIAPAGPARAPDRGAAAGEDPEDAEGRRPSSTWARTWSASSGCRLRGPAGTTVTLRHAEVLDKAGEFYTDNLRVAKQTVRYVLKGGAEETYEPRFTFQGFRYVAVEGWPGEPTLDSLTGVVVHSDMARDRQLQELEPAPRPAPAQHRLGPEGQLPRRAHGLPAARRAARLDRGRAGLRAHRRLQHGRGRLLQQVAGRRRGRPERERQRAARDPRRAELGERVRRRLGGLGGRGRDHPVDDVPRLRRHAAPRAAVPEHEGLGRVHARRRRARTSSGARAATSATGSRSPRPSPTTRARRRART